MGSLSLYHKEKYFLEAPSQFVLSCQWSELYLGYASEPITSMIVFH